MPRKPRQGRAVPSEPPLTSPLPTTSTTSCVVINDHDVCLLNDNNHVVVDVVVEHNLLLADYLRREWGVNGAKLLIEEHGALAVTNACRHLVEMQDRKADAKIYSRSGFAVRLIQRYAKLQAEAPAEEKPNLRLMKGGAS
ncbi:MAG: hypothetical protein L0177_06970 [Chloroflexi bacterium]|nr:hypothetical protein [Chloroflexota bacterium]